MKTHIIINLTYHKDEGNQVFAGTQIECMDFVAEQTQGSVNTYQIVPMTPEKYENYNS